MRDEELDMSDLSNLLGDVYGDHASADAAPVRHEPAAIDRMPEWSDPSPARPAIDDDLAAALSAALTEQAPAPVAAPVAPAPVAAAPAPVAPAPAPSWSAPAPMAVAPAPIAAPARMWAPGDDDIFPIGRGEKTAKAGKSKRKAA